MPKVHIRTYGCQMNERDSEQDERDAGVIHREHREGVEADNQADDADRAGIKGARIHEFED